MELISEFARSRDVAVVSPAGCGKTNLIAEATALYNSGYELILTHTHAGVHAVRNRLRQFSADPSSYSVDTIAGWSLRYASAYPSISKLVDFVPGINDNWDSVYESTIRLLENPTIQEIIKRSYSGLYVDEYQDCLESQHQIIKKLATLLPCRIVGDPLQSIFGFGNNLLAEWDSQVMSSFKTIGELETPWRWVNTNPELGEWLKQTRSKLLAKQVIDLNNLPKSIRWIPSSDIVEQRKSYWRIGNSKGETTCIIGSWESQCHSLARNTGGFFNSMETIECKDLFTWVLEIEGSHGPKRAQVVWEFAGLCCSKVKTISKDITRRISVNAKPIKAIPENVIVLLRKVAEEESIDTVLPTLEEILKMPEVKLFRSELYHEMCRTLKEHISEGGTSLQESALSVRDRTRRFGRRLPPRTVSRTLLIKGLEFDHCMVMGADSLNRNNLYVALTRASKTLTIVSKEPKLLPNS